MVMSQTTFTSQASEQRCRHLFENMPISIFAIDLTTNPAVIMDANRWAGLVYGYPAGELAGVPVAQLLPIESRDLAQKILQRVRHGETVTSEINNQHRDSTIFPVRLVATLDPENSDYMIIAAQDITAERQRRSETEATDADRLRIAHEIHDSVAQSLAGLRFKAAFWQHQADAAPNDMRVALSEIQDVLSTAITDIRRIIFALRPVDLDGLGFLPTLTQLVGDFGDQHQLVARLEVPEPRISLPAIYELLLFRVIQEGLNNIKQHANASSVQVHLDVDATGRIILNIHDNGRGFDPTHISPVNHPDHFGLRQMRERILSLGGTLDIYSVIGRGTDLLITLPPVTAKESHAAD